MASLSPRTCGAEGCILPQGHQDDHRSATGHRWPWTPIAGPDRDDLEEAARRPRGFSPWAIPNDPRILRTPPAELDPADGA